MAGARDPLRLLIQSLSHTLPLRTQHTHWMLGWAAYWGSTQNRVAPSPLALAAAPRPHPPSPASSRSRRLPATRPPSCPPSLAAGCLLGRKAQRGIGCNECTGCQVKRPLLQSRSCQSEVV